MMTQTTERLTECQVDYHRNSLNTLKLIAAIQVVYGHISAHMCYSFPKQLSQILGIFMGVPIFFVLSGFLIWNSIKNSSNYKHYLSKRFKRIYPELWLGVFLEIIVLLILFDGETNYLLLSIFTVTQATFLQFWTPDFLRTYGCGVPNGALWTICVTIQFYIVAWILYKLLHKKSVYRWMSVFALSILFKLLFPFIEHNLPQIIYDLFKVSLLPYLWLFVLGIFLSEFRDKTIPFLKKYWWLLFCLSFVFSITKFDIDRANYGVMLYTLRVPGMIGLAYALPKINIKWDISYGLYIYHMIVINAMIEMGFVGRLYYIIIAFILSILMACISTFLSKLLTNNLKTKKHNEV